MTLRMLGAAIAFGLMASVSSAATLLNSDFDSLAGWTATAETDGVFFTSVEAFNTTGAGMSSAARLEVGRVSGSGSAAGGNLSQDFIVMTAGIHEFSIDVAAVDNRGSTNMEGGIFSLLVDGVLLDSFAAGSTGPAPRRATLSGQANLALGTSTFTIRVERPFTVSNVTPFQYLDNAQITGPSPVPLPAALPLLAVGVGGLFAARRFKRA